jgi:CBS domain-containing protein
MNLKPDRAMRVTDVMSTQVLTVDQHQPLERARSTMSTRPVHHLVVVDGSKVVGLVTPELLAWGEAEGIARVEDVMFRHHK